ncbi:histone [archaeon]|nr:MAG: histone [archaeon]RLG65345.1 MAG: histone [archaeon]RLG66383.1 MAG: histone [archaeon]HDM23650.1 histone family protein [Candidatus Bathyarchaeota archaeon]
MTRVRQLPIAPIHRLIKSANAERVSDEAAKVLRDILEEIGFSIAQRAIEIAKHANRKTVTAEDIRLAYRFMKSR